MLASRIVRSRYCFFTCCSVALCLLVINTIFLFTGVTKQLHPENLSSQGDISKNAQYETINFPILEPAFDKNLTTYRNIDTIINSHRRASSLRDQINLSTSIPIRSTTADITNTSRGFNEPQESLECGNALSESQWMLWNLVDLCLFSAGPFMFLVPLNLSIICRVSKYTFPSRLDSVAQRPIENSTSAQASNSGAARLIGTSRGALAVRDAKAERQVTAMLLVTTVAFLVMRTPITVGHALQMAITEKKLFALIQPATCMKLFAVAEVLAFGQHATQFYVNFACSARFRRALCRQFRVVVAFAARLVFEDSNSTTDPRRRALQLNQLTRYSPPILDNLSSPSHNRCLHQYVWIESHLLVCRLCFTSRLVHHPLCIHFHEENIYPYICDCVESFQANRIM